MTPKYPAKLFHVQDEVIDMMGAIAIGCDPFVNVKAQTFAKVKLLRALDTFEGTLVK